MSVKNRREVSHREERRQSRNVARTPGRQREKYRHLISSKIIRVERCSTPSFFVLWWHEQSAEASTVALLSKSGFACWDVYQSLGFVLFQQCPSLTGGQSAAFSSKMTISYSTTFDYSKICAATWRIHLKSKSSFELFDFEKRTKCKSMMN